MGVGTKEGELHHEMGIVAVYRTGNRDPHELTQCSVDAVLQ